MTNLARKITEKQDVSSLLSQITVYREKTLHLQAHSDLLSLLFAFNHQSYARYLTQHHVELTNLSITKPEAYSDLEAVSLGASFSGNKFSIIPGDLVTEVTIKRQVKVRDGPMRAGYITSINAENNFILHSHILAKIRKER